MDRKELTPEEMLVERARLGIECEAFLTSSVGYYLMDSASIKIEANTKLLVKASSTDIELNTTLRNEINIGTLFIGWLNEAVNSGKRAHSELDGLDTADY